MGSRALMGSGGAQARWLLSPRKVLVRGYLQVKTGKPKNPYGVSVLRTMSRTQPDKLPLASSTAH
jgi:hypothetical protein